MRLAIARGDMGSLHSVRPPLLGPDLTAPDCCRVNVPIVYRVVLVLFDVRRGRRDGLTYWVVPGTST